MTAPVTDEDRETATDLVRASMQEVGIAFHRPEQLADAIAAALAEARENERERTLQGATVAQIQATPRRQIADQQARHEVELRALQSQIAELTQERDRQYDYNVGQIAKQAELEAELDRLRGLLRAPGLYPPTYETDRKPTL